jgi:GGDEF domain-containing protein
MIELLDQLARALARARRWQTPVAVMVAGYADLDWLTEAFVPSAIDRRAVRAAERLALRVRSGDVLARLDPMRFAVVLDGDADQAQGLEARVGISLYPDDGDDPETLLGNASVAWTVANSQNGVRFYADGRQL